MAEEKFVFLGWANAPRWGGRQRCWSAAPLPPHYVYLGMPVVQAATRVPLGRFLIRLCDLVGAPRGRTGPFFCLPGSGGHLGDQPPSGVVGRGPRGGATGGAALFFFQGGSLRDNWLDRAGAACPVPVLGLQILRKKVAPLVYR
jgi:hypothetical protein